MLSVSSAKVLANIPASTFAGSIDRPFVGYLNRLEELTWIASSAQAESGTFVASLAPESEGLVYQLWPGNSAISGLLCVTKARS